MNTKKMIDELLRRIELQQVEIEKLKRAVVCVARNGRDCGVNARLAFYEIAEEVEPDDRTCPQ